MFPLGDDNSQRRSVPVVTFVLIALNVLVFLVELNGGQAFIQQWAFVPRKFSADPGGQAHTIFTAMFMHGGWLHLFGNMLYLWIFGDNVEDRLGHVRFLFFYLFAGIAAALLQIFFNPFSTVPMIGASGAIAGVMGAYFVLYPQSRVLTVVFLLIIFDVVEIPAIFFLGIWFVMQLLNGVGSIGVSMGGGTAFWAHVGGFVVGVLAGVGLRRRDRRWHE